MGCANSIDTMSHYFTDLYGKYLYSDLWYCPNGTNPLIIGLPDPEEDKAWMALSGVSEYQPVLPDGMLSFRCPGVPVAQHGVQGKRVSLDGVELSPAFPQRRSAEIGGGTGGERQYFVEQRQHAVSREDGGDFTAVTPVVNRPAKRYLCFIVN